MKSFRFGAVSFLILAFMGLSAMAQTTPATKIGWLDTGAFGDPKEGITKYLNALTALENEMKPRVTELQTIQNKLNTLNEDIKKMGSNPAIPVNQTALAQKQDEGARLQREGEFKKKEYDAALEKRSGEILGPVSADIQKAIQDYAKLKGYAVVLDVDKLYQANVILVLDPAANLTKEFVTYYNARPATTASTTTPK